MSRGPNYLRIGQAEEAAASSTDYTHSYVSLKESIAPGGSAKGFKLVWDGSDWVSDAKYMSSLAVNASNALYVANLRGTADSTNEMFEAADAGETLSITGSVNGDFTVEDYAISAVTVPLYYDLMVDADNAAIVTSAARPFTALDAGLELLVTSDDGFLPGLYPIVSVDVATGKATLDRPVGTLGQAGGWATGTPYAKLDATPAAAGSTLGSGVVGAIDIYEVLGAYRAWGTDDLGDPVNHLAIDATDNTKISNAGTAFDSDDDDKRLIIEGGTGFTAGEYHVVAEEDGVLTLDRECGTAGSTLGYGSILRADPAIGIAEYKSDSERWELVTLHCIAKTALAEVVGDYTPSDGELIVKNFRAMDGGQNALPDAIVASYSNLCTPVGVANQIYNAGSLFFTSNDVGLIITFPPTPATRLIPGDYEITAVTGAVATLDRNCVETAYDLAIPAGETTKVSSATLGLAAADETMFLTITGGTGFTTGSSDITDVTGGVATIDGTAGTAESVGGVGFLSGGFNGSGKTYKALEIFNDGFFHNSGEDALLLWNESDELDEIGYRVWKDGGGEFQQCTCQLTADMATTDAVCSVDGIVATHGSSPGTSLTGVKNALGFEGTNDQACLIEFWPNQGYWVVFPLC